mgnify:FL=1
MMKIVYCVHSVYNPGGMERVLLNKVTYLSQHTDWEILIVTTDQKGRPAFYPFPDTVRMIDLDINYSDDNNGPVWTKVLGYLKRKRAHKKRLTRLLYQEKPDFVVSLYPSESSFIPDIKDGSKKILELHYCKFFRLQYGRQGILGLIDKWRTRTDERLVRRFDRFVVLTQEDRQYWGDLPNIQVIPNAAMRLKNVYADPSVKRVLAVGRLDYQKGFDKLIQAWKLVKEDSELSDWKLDIFGQGEWKDKLLNEIKEYGLEDSLEIHAPTTDIGQEYVSSSILVMSSNYEGFPMVMIEAMACGVPVVSFAFKCGPKDIIRHQKNGLIVPEGDIVALAKALSFMMKDNALRAYCSQNAREIIAEYSEEVIMKKWMDLFIQMK